MSDVKIAILDSATLDLPASKWEELSQIGESTLYDRTPYDEDTIIQYCESATIVLTNKVPLSEKVINALPKLSMIGVLATGYNVIDLDAAKARGIVVCNVPAYSTESVAQHAFALIMELCNRVGLHDDSVKARWWVESPDFAYWKQPIREIADLTVGLVGLGMIGGRVGEMLAGFGCNILASSRRQRKPLTHKKFKWAKTEELFEKSDIVSLHCPQTDENTEFVNSELLAKMKPTSFLVNTSRGALINEADLRDALDKGTIAGAAVDVISKEPMLEDNPLLRAKNIIITPHMAWSSVPSRDRLFRITMSNIRGFLNGDPINVIK